MNSKKVIGIIICLAGVALAKAKNFVPLSDQVAIICYSIGALIAFSGIAVFTAGMKSRIEKKIKVCPNCFFKNDAQRETCMKCRKDL